MQSACAYKYCYYNYAKDVSQEEQKTIQTIYCPQCKKIKYCSERCREIDWNTHKNDCQKAQDPDDTLSTIKSTRHSVEDYEVVQTVGKKGELGRGSYGCVKLVRDKKSGEFFAMKIMSKKSIFEYCTVQNLKREIKIQKSLSHPHITKLFHYFEDKENVYLILEFADNGSLFNYLRKKKRFTENEAFVYFFQTCLGIDYLHKKNIIHRDLKPENLLLDKSGNIKLCDFGWSAESQANNKRTTFCGTIDYMAPEMIKNQPHDHRLDIWCLGILMYELLHGYPPFKGKNDNEKCFNISNNAKVIYDNSITKEAQELMSNIVKTRPQERLTMQQIFEHPWMFKMQKHYGIDIKQYIYQSENDVQIDCFQKPNQFEQRNKENINIPSRAISQNKYDIKQKETNEYDQLASKYGLSKNYHDYQNQDELKGQQNNYASNNNQKNYGQFNNNYNNYTNNNVQAPIPKVQYEKDYKPQKQQYNYNSQKYDTENYSKFQSNQSTYESQQQNLISNNYAYKSNYQNNYKQNQYSHQFDQYLNDDMQMNERVSRVSSRNFLNQSTPINDKKQKQQENTKQEDESFIDKILIAFGCISRDKNKQPQSDMEKRQKNY